MAPLRIETLDDVYALVNREGKPVELIPNGGRDRGFIEGVSGVVWEAGVGSDGCSAFVNLDNNEGPLVQIKLDLENSFLQSTERYPWLVLELLSA